MPLAVRATLPLPPSVNELYANVPGKGRVLTAKYAQWRKDAGWLLRPQLRGAKTFAGRFGVLVLVPADMPGDCDGRLKAPIDLLVEHRVIPDDRFAWFTHARRDEAVTPRECIVSVEPVT